MHATIRALLELDDVNKQRQIFAKQRLERSKRLKEAQDQAKAIQEQADAAQTEAESHDALIRQYEGDITRCDETVEKLRTEQLEAKTNKAYLACINGIENAKSEKRKREESLKNLKSTIDELQAQAAAAKAKAEEADLSVEAIREELDNNSEADTSEEELNRIYDERKKACDPKFLEVYERLVHSRHPRPLMQVDPRTRATPMGNCISTNALESLRLGQLITDPVSNAILYVDEDNTKEADTN